jgi:hypothetical protein
MTSKKADVIEQLGVIFASVESMLSDLVPVGSDNEITPIAENFKDVVGHLAFWDQNFTNLLKSALKLEPRTVLMGTLDEINARNFAEAHQKHISQVVEEFKETCQKLIDAVDLFTDEDLTEPRRFEAAGEQPLGQYIVHEVRGHYNDHMDELRALWTNATGQQVQK